MSNNNILSSFETTAKVMTVAIAHSALLGECLLWEQGSQIWWWTDIDAATIYSGSVKMQQVFSYRLPDRVGSFAHCRSGRLLLGLSKRLCLAGSADEFHDGGQVLVETLAAVDPMESRTRINDGRTDRAGRFVFGTMNEAADKREIASFYQYSVQYGLRRLALPAVTIANSICFSLDGKTMYFSDTKSQRIQQCDYDSETATVATIRLFAAMDINHAFPDGAVIDRNGCLWNAQWGASRVVQYDPDGRMQQQIIVPVKNPTCPCFGGEKMDQLMVTSSRLEMSSQELKKMPEAGCLFAIQLEEFIGVSDALFDDLTVTGLSST